MRSICRSRSESGFIRKPIVQMQNECYPQKIPFSNKILGSD